MKIREVFIRGHAIDRASQRMLGQWAAECPQRDPGLHEWLLQMAHVAIATLKAAKVGSNHVTYRGVDFKFFVTPNGIAYLQTLFFRSGDKVDEKRDGRAPRECRVCGEPECDCPVS